MTTAIDRERDAILARLWPALAAFKRAPSGLDHVILAGHLTAIERGEHREDQVPAPLESHITLSETPEAFATRWRALWDVAFYARLLMMLAGDDLSVLDEAEGRCFLDLKNAIQKLEELR